MKDKLLKLLVLSFLIFFLVLLFAEKFGYYETKEERAKTLTEEQIKIFEKDIEEEKNIDISDYVLNKNNDYTTSLSKGIYKVSLKLEKAADKIIKIIFNRAGKMVNE